MANEKNKPDYQWQGAQGYEWWELAIVRDKFTSSEQELLIKINDSFVVRVFPTKPYPKHHWSKTQINGAYYETSCEHVDEDLYWLFDNLEKLVFLHNTKKNKVKTIQLKKFEQKKNKYLNKKYLRIYTWNTIIKKESFNFGMTATLKEIQRKNELKQKYKNIFKVVKKHIDKLDPIGLLEGGAPNDEYDMETADILLVAMNTKDADELADSIINIFDKAFGGEDEFKIKNADAHKIAETILNEIIEEPYKNT